MKFLLRHFLLLGVILGLAGQGAAFASTPCPMMQQEQSSAMSEAMAGMPDCTMAQGKSGKGSTPSRDMTPGCLAMAGCAAPIALDIPPPVAINRPVAIAIYQWMATPVLHGRVVPPDPYPPSILG